MLYQYPTDNGKYLYHFTKPETALLYILPSKKLKLNSVLESNDPKENKTFGFWSILSKIDQFDFNTVKEAYRAYIGKNCKQLCFSLDYSYKGHSVPGYRHPTMWAHYADKSRGICLVLNKDLFINENSNLDHNKITYKTSLKFPNLDGIAWKKRLDKYFGWFIKKNVKKLFFTKHSHWKMEHEYKFIGIEQPEYCSIENSLVGLYLGPDFDHKLHNLVFELIKPFNGQIEKIIIDDGHYQSIMVDYQNYEG